jgi:hypothetical protein
MPTHFRLLGVVDWVTIYCLPLHYMRWVFTGLSPLSAKFPENIQIVLLLLNNKNYNNIITPYIRVLDFDLLITGVFFMNFHI